MENSTHDYTLHLFLVSFVCETFNVGRGRFLTIGRQTLAWPFGMVTPYSQLINNIRTRICYINFIILIRNEYSGTYTIEVYIVYIVLTM